MTNEGKDGLASFPASIRDARFFFLANFLKPVLTPVMIRVIAVVCASSFALLAASCCCTSEPKAPKLRPLPAFKEIESAPQVNYTK
jgi:hypothetical protein